ncbi:MAG: DUF2007 domain-containing protein [Rhodospirillales bacterium]
MIELIRTNDPVLLSWLTAHLDAAGVGNVVLDAHTSNMEGSIGAIPRRVMVLADDEAVARDVLAGCPAFADETEDDAVQPALRPGLAGA